MTILAVCKCGALVPTKPCPNCRRADNQRRHHKSVAHGLRTRSWQLLRKQRLELDSYRCTFRFRGCTGRATTVHLDATLRGNHQLATLADLRSACHHCHGTADAPRSRSPRPPPTPASR